MSRLSVRPSVVTYQPYRPPAIPGVPTGLEYLSGVEQLLVHQQLEIIEIVTSWETSNQYQIKNTLGQQVYFANEESNMCARQCCGKQRGFTMHITDLFGVEVIRAVRKFKCCAKCPCCACISCCAMEIAIEAPVGQVIGYTTQSCSIWKPRFIVSDGNREPVFRIKGPCFTSNCSLCCSRSVDFKYYSVNDDSNVVGKLSKLWSGFGKEIFSDADDFLVTFPLDLDINLKATLLGTIFLIDFMYFESKKDMGGQGITTM